jgi:hypothetical protein
MVTNKVSSLEINLVKAPQGYYDEKNQIYCWISACLLGLAIFLGDGMGSLASKVLLLTSTFFAAMAPWKQNNRIPETLVRFLLLILLILMFAIPVTRIPGYYLQATSQSGLPYWLGLRSLAATAGILCWFHTGNRSKALFSACCTVLLFAGLWTLRASPSPSIDVFSFFDAASSELTKGGNPYGISMPNIYGPNTNLYAPDLQQGDALKFGFPYPLTTLLAGWFGNFLFPDYRFAFFALYVLSAFFLGLQGEVEKKIALLALFFPRLEFIFEQGWSDGLSGALLLGTTALSARIPGALLAGLWISSKQYLIPFILPWMSLYHQEKKRSLVCMATVVSLYLLPLCNDPQAYLWSTFGLQFLQPFRPDSLSYLFGPVYLLILGVIIWLFGLLTRIKTILNEHKLTPNAALELVFWLLWAFFIFNKQAFANYYFSLYLLTLFTAVAFLPHKGKT